MLVRLASVCCLSAVVLMVGCGPSPHFAHTHTDEGFYQQINRTDQPVLVEFYKNGCPACIRLAGTMDSLAREYSDRVHFVMMEQQPAEDGISDSRRVRSQYGFYQFPTVALFVNGELRAHWVNEHDRGVYTEALDTAIAEMGVRPAQDR